MMKVLIAEDEPDLRDIIRLVVESEFDVEVTEVSSGEEAIDLLSQKEAQFDIILSDYHMPKGTGGDVFNFLEAKRLKTPFVLVSASSLGDLKEFKVKRPDGYVDKMSIHTGLVEIIKKLLVSEEKEKSQEKYLRVHIVTLIQMGLTRQDLYLRLSSGRYVHVFRPNDSFTEKDFNRFHLKKISYLYLKKEDVASFVANYEKSLALAIVAKKLDSEIKLSLSKRTQEVCLDLGKTFGWGSGVERLVRQNVELSLSILKENQNTVDFIKKFETSEESYVANHAILTSQIAYGTANLLNWGSDFTLQKLVFASLMQNVSIPDVTLKQVLQLERFCLENQFLENEEVKAYREHPMQSAVVLEEWSHLPPETAEIVRCHHERPDGKGFPRRLKGSHLTPLAALFIISQDLAGFILQSGKRVQYEKFFDEREALYSASRFKEPFEALLLNFFAQSIK
jgi:response regulator RpfG family c-di-GMP phosphodiesterase